MVPIRLIIVGVSAAKVGRHQRGQSPGNVAEPLIFWSALKGFFDVQAASYAPHEATALILIR